MFLTQRKMKVVIDGDVSEEATVDSEYHKELYSALSSSFATLMRHHMIS
jgi:hypothetical protein